MTSEPGGTGLIVEVPEAEPLVGAHRLELDPSAPLGVPAHVTVLFPFVPVELIDTAVLGRLGELFADHPTFDVRLTRTAWFGQAVLWLAPQDPEPFRRMTSAVVAAFPHYPPYRGLHEGVTPHLTIGNNCDHEHLLTAERQVAAQLPVCARADAVTLISQQGDGGPWSRIASFALRDRAGCG